MLLSTEPSFLLRLTSRFRGGVADDDGRTDSPGGGDVLELSGGVSGIGKARSFTDLMEPFRVRFEGDSGNLDISCCFSSTCRSKLERSDSHFGAFSWRYVNAL